MTEVLRLFKGYASSLPKPHSSPFSTSNSPTESGHFPACNLRSFYNTLSQIYPLLYHSLSPNPSNSCYPCLPKIHLSYM